MKAAAAADSDRAPASSRDHSREADGWLTGTLIAIFVVVCCAGPLLIGALAAAGAGAWLATHGYAIGATALLVVQPLSPGGSARASAGDDRLLVAVDPQSWTI